MFNFSDQLDKISRALNQVSQRFPFSLFIVSLLTLLLMGGVWRGYSVTDAGLSLLILFFASVGFYLRGEAEGKPRFETHFFIVLVAGLIGVLFYFADHMLVTPMALLGGVLLAASGAAYRSLPTGFNSTDAEGYWLFNYRFWLALVVALIAGALIAGLVLLILAAVAALFDLSQGSSLQQYILIISLFFIAPLIWLSLMPQPFEKGLKAKDLEQDFLLKIIGMGIKYVLIPVFFILAAIFHGLIFKIYMDHQLPEGQVGWFGLVLGIGGALIYLMGQPYRGTGNRLVSLFYKYWALMLIIPALLIASALYIRVQEHGFTPARVLLLCFLFWLGFLIIYSLYCRLRETRADMRLFSGSAALLLVVMSFGFWGAEGLSLHNQKQRLVALLEKNDLLVFGQLRLPGGLQTPLSARDTEKISAILNYMSVDRRGDALLPLLDKNQRNDVLKARSRGAALKGGRNRVMKAMRQRLDEATIAEKGGDVAIQDNKRYSYRASTPYGVAIFNAESLNGPFFYALNGQSKSSDNQVQVVREDGSQVTINFAVDGQTFLISGRSGELARFSIEAFVDLAKDHQGKLSLMQKNGTAIALPLRIIYPQGAGRELGMKLYLTQMQYEMVASQPNAAKINEIRFFLAGNTRLD